MSNNQISILKLKFKTNVRGHTNYVTYNVKYNDKTIPDRMIKENQNLPAHCMFFSDLIPFSKNDYSNKYGTFLKSLISINEFSRIFKKKLDEEYNGQKINRKEAFKEKVHENNLLLLLKLIFKPGSPFYLIKDENPFTILKVKEEIHPVHEGKIVTKNNNKYRLYEYRIFLKLSNKTPGEISKAELDKSNCEDIKYNLDAITYKLLSENISDDGYKKYYKKKYDTHLKNGEAIIDKNFTPRMYSKKGGTKKIKTRKNKNKRKYTLKKYDMFRMPY